MRIPALMYHELVDEKQSPTSYAVKALQFEGQMRYLHDSKFCPISVEQYLDVVDDGQPGFPQRSIFVTFDDGYASCHDLAARILKQYNFAATVFVTTGLVGSGPRWMDATKLRALQNQGISVQAHSHSHPFLTDIPPQRIKEELAGSKAMLEDMLGKELLAFSCPGGRFNKAVLEIARDVGYRAVFTSRPALNRAPANRRAPYLVHRFLIGSHTDPATFNGIVDQKFAVIKSIQFKNIAKFAVKRLAGNRLYHRLWRRFR